MPHDVIALISGDFNINTVNYIISDSVLPTWYYIEESKNSMMTSLLYNLAVIIEWSALSLGIMPSEYCIVCWKNQSKEYTHENVLYCQQQHKVTSRQYLINVMCMLLEFENIGI